jgi:glycosyltransferase involved in cell wall biosynthesis
MRTSPFMSLEMPVVLDTRVVTGRGGGPEKTILNSPRYLEPAGYRMLCAYMHPPRDPGFEDIRRRARDLGAPLLSVPDRGPLDLRVIPRLLEICRRERVAIWHAHDYKSNLLGLLLRQAWPMRLVTTVHGWVERTRRTPLYYAIDWFSLPRYERVLCVSQDVVGRCRALGVPTERCLLVENGIDLDRYTRRVARPEAKRRLNFAPDRPVVGAVGRLSPEKGFDVLIRAADRLLRRGFDFELVIAGEGGHRPELERLISDLGCSDRVLLPGHCDDPVPLFEALDAFALSSLREGLPNVLLEAMALGVPVVATRIAGVPRVVRDGENGLLVEPGTVEGLAEALARVLADRGLGARLGAAGRATVESGFDFGSRMRTIKALYDDLLGTGPVPAGLNPAVVS